MRASEITGVVVFAWSCGDCRGEAPHGGSHEYAPGRWILGPVCTRHVPELVALGWEVTTYRGEPPDIACSHYRALCEAAEAVP